MQKLEEIDDDAAQEKINFVQILDQSLANEYGLETIPALVYYRNKVPIVYQSMYIIIDSSFNFIHMIHPIQLILLLIIQKMISRTQRLSYNGCSNLETLQTQKMMKMMITKPSLKR